MITLSELVYVIITVLLTVEIFVVKLPTFPSLPLILLFLYPSCFNKRERERTLTRHYYQRYEM